MELEIRLSVRQLVEFLRQTGSIDSRFSGFDRALEGARIHRRLQKQAGEGYEAEVPLKRDYPFQEAVFTLEGRADGIFTDENGVVTIDEIKTTDRPPERITMDHNPVHWAQGQVYAAIWAAQNQLDQAAVRLTYFATETEEIIRYTRLFSAAELEDFVRGLLEEYLPWARRQAAWERKRTASLARLAFPFSRYRTGQHALAGAVYKAMRAGENLLVQAPTGTGKTMSTLFPSLRAMGDGCGQRLFYLTAKTTTRAAAEEALGLLRQKNPDLALRWITLTAKDKVCLLEERQCTPDACPYANGYYDRVKDAVWAALDEEEFSRIRLEELARRFTVCPFELGLDLSLWCDAIIGDYNYLFDPTVCLHRFFDSKGDYLFLVDEAHNLVERARDMYSASLQKSAFLEVKKALGRKKGKLGAAIQKINNTLLELRRRCEEEGGEEKSLVLPEPQKELNRLLERAVGPFQEWLEQHEGDPAHPVVLQLYFDVKFYLRMAELYDDHYVTLLHAFGSDLRITQLCLDPSDFLADKLAKGRGAVLFSATLSPGRYYRDTLGAGEEARLAALPSPFAHRQLGLFALPVSTKYQARQAGAEYLARCIAAMAGAKTGNYIAFFPSYQYLEMVREPFERLFPDIEVLAQAPGLSDEERSAFLDKFTPDPERSMVAFCVMGGVFGEGVDLAGSRLIGAAIVGVGLPQVSARQNALRCYYDQKNSQGFEYAYQYPGLNKVLQAAGRVIRTESDRGVVLLLDERFYQPRYRQLLPPHWQHCRFVDRGEDLSALLADFWNQE